MGLLKEGGNVGILQTAADKIGTAVAAAINALASIWDKFTASVTAGVNASNGLKENGFLHLLDRNIDFKLRIRREGVQTPYSIYNALGQGATAAGALAWQLATPNPATITPNTFVTPFTTTGGEIVLYTEPGRTNIVSQVKISATGDCLVRLERHFYTRNYLNGLNSNNFSAPPTLNGVVSVWEGVIDDTSGGTVTFDFPDNLILLEGERLCYRYLRKTATGGIQLSMSVTASNITNDFNYDAKTTIVTVGDSIGKGTVAYGELQDGIFSFMLRDYINENGGDCRLVNKSFLGANSMHWDWLTRAGELDFHFDALVINIGMNDCVVQTGYVQTGISYFRQAIVNIINRAKRRNKNVHIFINGITQTDDTARSTNIQAYRNVLAEFATPSNVAGLISSSNISFIDTSTAFTASQTQYFTETATPRIHPNAAGNLLMWNIARSIVAATPFYNKVIN